MSTRNIQAKNVQSARVLTTKTERRSQNFNAFNVNIQYDADHVGAMNILAAGLAAMACRANSIKSWQQEPIGSRKEVLSFAF